ncbi:Wzz/FepE/Etk N-terminal domain-containing protein [Dokdonia sp. R86516]|uniref:Wzz/FepE/Etk N-terminal domain-containing protein n=1 Tax=Dokdonia sp. R86516 TaxID=3093856 RepID=UPI0037C63035
MKKDFFVDDKVNVSFLIDLLLSRKRFIIKVSILFFVVGLIVALFSKNYYTANTVLLPQVSSSEIKGGIGGLANLAGIDLSGGNKSQNISPILYPQIFESLNFQRDVINEPIKFSDFEKKLSYKDYYTNHYSPGFLTLVKSYTIGLPSKIIKSFSADKPEVVITDTLNSDILFLSNQEKKVLDVFKKSTNLLINAKEGYIEITTTMPDGVAAAHLTRLCWKKLEGKVIDMHVAKAKNELEFLEKRLSLKKDDFESIQRRLASYKDANRFNDTALSNVRLQKLNSEYSLAYNIYNEVITQVESQKLQVEKDTPIFMVLKNPIVKSEKSGPSKAIIIIGFLFVGVILSVLWIIFRVYWKEVILNN